MIVSVNGIETHYEVYGKGPWLTLSHSLACDASMWRAQIDALAERYRVLVYDTRGHGKTAAPQGPYTFDMLTADLLGLYDQLGIAASHFVGLSMGGMIGQHLALAAPQRVRALVLADTSSRFPPEVLPLWQDRIRAVGSQGMGAVVQGTLERWFTPAFRASSPDAVERVAALIRATPVAGYVGCCHCIPRLDITARIHAIKSPTLVIVGADDPGTPVAMSEAIVTEIPGARLRVIPQAAHLANIEQAAEFNRLLLEFLDMQR